MRNKKTPPAQLSSAQLSSATELERYSRWKEEEEEEDRENYGTHTSPPRNGTRNGTAGSVGGLAGCGVHLGRRVCAGGVVGSVDCGSAAGAAGLGAGAGLVVVLFHEHFGRVVVGGLGS